MERIRVAFAALKIPYFRTILGSQIMPKPWMHEEERPGFSSGALLD